MSEIRNIRCYFDDNGTFEDIDFQDVLNFVGEDNLLTTLKEVESKLIEAMKLVKDTNLTYETAEKIIREFKYLGTSSNGGINWITNLNFPLRSSYHTPATYTIRGDQTFYINSNISNDRWTGRGIGEFRNAIETFVEFLKEQNIYIKSSRKQIKSSKHLLKSGYYNSDEHPEGGGTCDYCQTEIAPGDGYEKDFQSTRDTAVQKLYKALGGDDKYSYQVQTEGDLERWLRQADENIDEDYVNDMINDVINTAFENKDGYMCHDCLEASLMSAAEEWVEENW